mgnify:CR=1 FL=1
MNGWKPWTTQYILRQQARRSEYGKTESDTGMGQGVPEKRQGGSQESNHSQPLWHHTGGGYVQAEGTEGKLPAIAVSGPFGAVKEQSSGLYAQKMAELGFLTIAFDPSYTGETSDLIRTTNHKGSG